MLIREEIFLAANFITRLKVNKMGLPNFRTNKENGKDVSDGGILQPVKVDIKPEDYYLHPKLVEEFEDMKTTILGINDFGSEMGARNYLLIGPPGTGKTLAARVVSAELGIPLYDISSFVKGQSAYAAQIFEMLRGIAAQNERGIIALIDEVEGLSSRDNVVDPLQYQALTQILSQMDGVQDNHGIFIIGTTNKPNDLDEALRSRFCEEIEFLPPDHKGRFEILKIHSHGKGGHKFEADDKDLERLAERSYGYVGRDLKQVLNRAFTHAKRNSRINVVMEDLEYGLKKTKPSAIRDMPFIEPKIKLSDMAGYEDHKALLRSVVERSAESIILLYGPKGTGKTMSAEALAGEFGYNFILIKGSELENMFVGKTKDNTERVISRAKQLSPCIVCFDEISSFVERKGTLSHKDSQTGYLQSVLSRPPEGVYILATDNNPGFLRGPFMDRFIHKLYFGMPGREEQTALWKQYAPGIEAERLVAINSSLSCRDIAYACQRVRDYGIEPSIDAFERLIKGIQPSDIKMYEQVAKEIGDGVRDYQALKEFRKGK